MTTWKRSVVTTKRKNSAIHLNSDSPLVSVAHTQSNIYLLKAQRTQLRSLYFIHIPSVGDKEVSGNLGISGSSREMAASAAVEDICLVPAETIEKAIQDQEEEYDDSQVSFFFCSRPTDRLQRLKRPLTFIFTHSCSKNTRRCIGGSASPSTTEGRSRVPSIVWVYHWQRFALIISTASSTFTMTTTGWTCPELLKSPEKPVLLQLRWCWPSCTSKGCEDPIRVTWPPSPPPTCFWCRWWWLPSTFTTTAKRTRCLTRNGPTPVKWPRQNWTSLRLNFCHRSIGDCTSPPRSSRRWQRQWKRQWPRNRCRTGIGKTWPTRIYWCFRGISKLKLSGIISWDWRSKWRRSWWLRTRPAWRAWSRLATCWTKSNWDRPPSADRWTPSIHPWERPRRNNRPSSIRNWPSSNKSWATTPPIFASMTVNCLITARLPYRRGVLSRFTTSWMRWRYFPTGTKAPKVFPWIQAITYWCPGSEMRFSLEHPCFTKRTHIYKEVAVNPLQPF